MTMVKADTYQSGRDADIMRERGLTFQQIAV